MEDGVLNASCRCLHRQVEAGLGDKGTLNVEADDPMVIDVAYSQLLERTCCLANALKARGFKKDERVVIHLGMSFEGVTEMQTWARIDATRSVFVDGFSAQSLRDRIAHTSAVMVITADERLRSGKRLLLKAIVGEALALDGCDSVKDVINYQRTVGKVGRDNTREHWLHDEPKNHPATCEREWVEADDLLFLPYTSGSTGKPKGLQHSTAATCCTGR